MGRASVNYYFQCQRCGKHYAQWVEQCDACENFSVCAVDLLEHKSAYLGPVVLADVPVTAIKRHPSGFAALDKVLGGGIAEGCAILLGGAPGSGKSTLLLQVLSHLAQSHGCGIVNVEESSTQLAARTQGFDLRNRNIWLVPEPAAFHALKQFPSRARFILIDSLQKMRVETPGLSRLGQLVACCEFFTKRAKKTGQTFFLIAHETKNGDFAGPETLQHDVDVTLWLEYDQEKKRHRLTCAKNRYGPSHVDALLTMGAQGFEWK